MKTLSVLHGVSDVILKVKANYLFSEYSPRADSADSLKEGEGSSSSGRETSLKETS